MAGPVLGIIGGSGFYEMDGIEGLQATELETPFGKPSDPFYRGRLGDCEVIFLARHGRGHRLMPTEINFRANVYGMKLLGAQYLVSVSTAGSLREELAPGELVVADQFIDRTFQRAATFFGNGIVAHVSMADPVCRWLSDNLVRAANQAQVRAHRGGTYLCIEGPQFSSRAESRLFRAWGADVISMTAVQEARLAREAELCYALLVLVTDYDCWHDSAGAVDIGEVIRVMRQNVERAKGVVAALARALDGKPPPCGCAGALRDAIVTDPALVPAARAAELRVLIGKYLAPASR
ncbi:MAG: S-methyl-5'-thioadenosine phosphorylase [Deltaproteobacteria bacterium]|jgi:5'-methylthioadenosine phosphorylase|nr:S-methyl-5'-thioadenosine phosphorylase [Deltaproteobacteria bacterium]